MINQEIFKIQCNSTEITRGDLLVAEPFLSDLYFERGVVLMVDHNNDEGSFGVMINKRLMISINEVIRNFPKFDAEFFLGGPVNSDEVFFIHDLGKMIPRSVDLGNGLHWGGNLFSLKPLILNDMIKPSNVKFFLGHSGWEAGQLKDELERNSWVVAKNIKGSDIMTTEPPKMWKKYASAISDNHKLWSKFPVFPIEN